MYFEEIELGTTIELEPVVIEKGKMIDFAKLYDNIPIHTDEEYAKKTHFGALIAPGVMSFMSVWVKFMELGVFGDEFLAGKSTSMEWLKPVYANDVLAGKTEITRLTKRNAKNGIVEVTVNVYNQNGVLVLTDVTEAIVKCKPQE